MGSRSTALAPEGGHRPIQYFYCLIMKLLVALALLGLACAAPEPDADAYYGYRGYYRPYYYGRRWYGKRQAEDEPAASGPNPDANADADAHGWGYWGGYYRPYYH